MSSTPRLGSFSTPNLIDPRYDEVKHRRHHDDCDDQTALATSRGPLEPPGRRLPPAARPAEKSTAARIRRSASMQVMSPSGSRNEIQVPESLQDLQGNLATLNNHIAGVIFKPDERRRLIRREIMQAQIHEFRLDKSLERILHAMYKAKNDLKEEKDRRPEEEVFRQSVQHAVQFGSSTAHTTAFEILKNKNKNRHGMSDTAASLAAGASVLALPVFRAVNKLTPKFILQGRLGNQFKTGPAAGMNAAQGHGQSVARPDPANEGAHAGMDIDALFGTPRDSMASRNDEYVVEGNQPPAQRLKRICKLMNEQGAQAALAAMDIDDAIVLSEFKGGINQLNEMMEDSR